MSNPIQIIYPDPGGEGYHCVKYMATLAAEMLEGELVSLPNWTVSFKDKLRAVFPHRRRKGSTALLICPAPMDLNAILSIPEWRSNRGRLVAWVFDSFWPEHIPQWVRWSRLFDHIFVTEPEDLQTWRRITGVPVDWLPWGSDVLDLGSADGSREFDLLRFGRQPAEWEDDASNHAVCEAHGLRFHGRPASYEDPADNERRLMRSLSNAKFALAFTNRVSRSIQTHPGREYITGRWTDALASGATVAGIPPRSLSVQSLLWPEALLNLGTVSRSEGIEVISKAVRSWTPALARHNYAKSLELLDWRWRFKRIAEVMELQPARLESELHRLQERLQMLRAAQAAF